jgi:Zn-dependent protease with chaperone function
MLRAFAAQSILHALVAGLLVEALLHAWRVDDGAWRLRFRLIALVEPVLVLPLLIFLAPWRSDPSFAVGAALFTSDRWNALHVGGVPLGGTIMVCAAGVGAALFLRDAAPPLIDALRGGRAADPLPAPVPAFLVERVAAHARALGIDAPTVRLLRFRLPVLLCERVSRPALVASTGTLDRLDEEALDAAVAHELAHAAHRDPGWGYALIALRALAFFNPAIQWTARAAVDDIERRADAVALRLTARPEALAAAVRTLGIAEANLPAQAPERFERRCARILAAGAGRPLQAGGLELGLAAAGIIGLLFFVV